MADYFAYWIETGRREGAKLPKVFLVNWFRKDDDGDFIWPGFGENIRVLEWIFRRCDDEGGTVETPIGLVPATGEIDIEGASVTEEQMGELLTVDAEAVAEQLPQIKEHLARFGEQLPDELKAQLETLEERLA
jgi:phosphoenolpyruvate carboxykinase (GTP)